LHQGWKFIFYKSEIFCTQVEYFQKIVE
jgi:hypothetical protein